MTIPNTKLPVTTLDQKLDAILSAVTSIVDDHVEICQRLTAVETAVEEMRVEIRAARLGKSLTPKSMVTVSGNGEEESER